MPIERRSASSQTTTVIVVITMIAAIALVFALLVRAASSGDGISLQLGDDRFDAGRAEDRAKVITSSGIPLLFSDVSGNGQNRPIFLNHAGEDFKTGWSAFDARPPDAPSGCYLEWDDEQSRFRAVDNCDDRTFPPDGEGLTSYPWNVDKDSGNLVIDLKPDDEK